MAYVLDPLIPRDLFQVIDEKVYNLTVIDRVSALRGIADEVRHQPIQQIPCCDNYGCTNGCDIMDVPENNEVVYLCQQCWSGDPDPTRFEHDVNPMFF